VLANERYVTERDTPRYEEARERLGGAMLVVDETSMVSSADMLKLHSIVEALGVDKLVLVGDRQQLSSIDAGKSFAMIQAAGGTMARMDENIRQRTDTLRTVAALANVGKAGEAMKVLGDNVHESANPPEEAADRWLALGRTTVPRPRCLRLAESAPSSTSASRTALPPRAPCGARASISSSMTAST
jgi:ATP-dependent exoDNAse (exonuclease V) alpha subunit